MGVSAAASTLSAAHVSTNGSTLNVAANSSSAPTSPRRSTNGAVSRKPSPATRWMATAARASAASFWANTARREIGCASSSSSVPAPSSPPSRAVPEMIAKTASSSGAHAKNSTCRKARGRERSLAPSPKNDS